MAKPRNGLIAALDIGSTKIACFIARMEPAGRMEIIGIGHHLSQGFKAGVITDVKKVEQSILAAVESAERMAAASIDRVVINVAGSKVTSHMVSSTVPVAGQITEKDINRVMAQSVELCYQSDTEIIHTIPLDYTIDGVGGIRDPKSMYGKQLTNHAHVITTSATNVMNLVNCLAHCQLDVEDLVAAPYAAGLSCLTADEMELGVTLLELGGGNTSFSLFKGGHIILAGAVPVGGQHITSDIAQGFSTNLTSAERIKTLHGNAVSTAADEDEMIDVPVMGEDEEEHSEFHYVSRAMLSNIIRPRVEEIFEMVKERLDQSGLDAVLGGKRMVLTGGGSQLLGIKELASHIFGKHVRIGAPKPVEGMAESTKSPAFSTVMGMLQFAANKSLQTRYNIEEHDNRKKTYVGKMLQWLQENF